MNEQFNIAADSSNPASRHLPELDGLRAVSIMVVLLIHVSYGRFGGGFLGVDIFFVLSGFLITALLVAENKKNGRISLAGFYLRRAFRILPPLVCGLILARLLWIDDLLADDAFWHAAWHVLLFVSNFADADCMGNLVHTWSLAIEEQFYLIWPLVLVLLRFDKMRNVTLLALALVGLAIGYRAFHLSSGGSPIQLYTMTIARMDGILIGGLLAIGRLKIGALLFRMGPDLLLWVVTCVMISILVCSNRVMFLGNSWAFTVFAVISALLILLSLMASPQHPVRRFLRLRAMRYLGTISYGLYVYHYPVFNWLEQFRSAGNLPNFIMVGTSKVVVSTCIAAISWHLIEKPMVLLRKKVLQKAS